MAENKKSFVLYADLLNTVSKLPDVKAGKLFKIILEYVNDKNPVVEDLILQVAFEPIRLQLKRDLVQWAEQLKKRSEAGKLGGIESGKKRGSKTKQKEAKGTIASKNEANEADTVTVTVTDTVIKRENTGSLANSNLFRKPVIPTLEKVKQVFSQSGGTDQMAQSFFSKHDGTGWFINGSPITNFTALVQKYITTWKGIEGNAVKTETVQSNHRQQKGVDILNQVLGNEQ